MLAWDQLAWNEKKPTLKQCFRVIMRDTKKLYNYGIANSDSSCNAKHEKPDISANFTFDLTWNWCVRSVETFGRYHLIRIKRYYHFIGRWLDDWQRQIRHTVSSKCSDQTFLWLFLDFYIVTTAAAISARVGIGFQLEDSES